MKTSKNILSAAMALALLTGCSSQPAAPAQTETDTVAASNVLRVGMECNYAPFNWTTTTQTDMTVQISGVDYADGYDVQIARKLADDLGMELQIVKLDWDSLILSLQKDQIDAVIAGMTATEERMKQVDFTTPYYVSEEVIIVRKDSDLANIKNVQELSGKKVQGQMNTIYDDIIDQIDGVQHMPAAETFPASIQALQAGGVDAVTSELPVAIGVVAANPDLTYIRFEAGKGFTDENGDATVSIAVSKDKPELLAQLQTALDKISEDDRNAMMQAAVERQPAGE
ncbi:MAG: transporter substrate-binding domain-containing protein [Solobacterium sp.]|nr:transporter substrate-binding domain-containing protein [Solobacterium sp.]